MSTFFNTCKFSYFHFIRKSHAIHCLKFACKHLQIAFDFLRAFSRFEGSQLQKTLQGKQTKIVSAKRRHNRFRWLNKQSKFERISFNCSLNSQEFGIWNPQIAFALRVAMAPGGGVLHYKFIRGRAPQGFLLQPNPRNLVRY